MQVTRRGWLRGAAGLALGGMLSACVPALPPLRVGANFWPGYLPLRYASHVGLLDVGQARVVDFSSTSAVISAFRDGSIDLAALTLDEFLMLSAEGSPLRAVLVFDVSDGADAVVARQPFRSVRELRGRRVGAESGALGAYMLARALALADLRPDEIQLIEMPVDRHEQAFARGEVDAVVTFDPARSRLLGMGGIEVFSSRQIPGEVVDVLACPVALLKTRRAAVRAVVDAHFSALPQLLSQPDMFLERLGGRAGLGARELHQALAQFRIPDRAGNLRLLGSGDASLRDAMARMAQLLHDKGLVSRRVETASLLDASVVGEGRA